MGDRHAVYDRAVRQVAERRRAPIGYQIIEWLWLLPTAFFAVYFGFQFLRVVF